MFKRLLGLTLMVLALTTSTVSAQVTIPNTFVTRAVISSSKINANFNQLGTQALNRAAPVLQATLTVDTDASYDLGQVATRFRNAYLSGTIAVGSTSTFTGLITATGGVASAAPVTISIANAANTALAVRFNGSNSLVGFAIANSNGFGYVGWNTIAQVGSDIPKYDITGAAGRIYVNSGTGTMNFETAASGTGGTAITFTSAASLTSAGALAWGGGSAISTSSSVALLTAGNTFSFAGTQTIGPGGTGANSAIVINGANATGGGGFIQFQKNGTSLGDVGSTSAILGAGTLSDLAVLARSGNGIGFYSNGGNLRWGINSAGDFTFGASNHIFASNGTPTCGANCSSFVSGATDYNFQVNLTSGGASTTTVNFGHTWTNAPSCMTNHNGLANYYLISAVSTTSVSFLPPGTTSATVLYVHCFSS